MAISHDEASTTSRTLCESLFAGLSNHLTDLTRGERGGTHVFAVPGRPQLTWVYHRKTLAKVEIWPYFDHRNVGVLHKFVEEVGLTLKPRLNYKGIGRLYPLPIELVTQEDVGKALQVLLFAHKAQRESSVNKASHTLVSTLQTQANESFSEGAPKTITLTRYERDSGARSACIAHYGAKCLICSFDFEAVYGKLGKGFIHVHHVVKLSKVRKKYMPDPKKDLLPVCPNCHAMLHRTDPGMTVEELKALIRQH